MAKKIEFPAGSSLESVANELLAAKARGEQVYGKFNGYTLYSDNATMDSIFMEVIGCTKAEYDLWLKKEIQKEETEARKNQMYKEMVNNSRIPGQEVVITMPVVIEGLKFIAENQSLTQEELIQALLDLGCNFTLEDISKLGPSFDLFDGMETGNLTCGATVIVNMRDSEVDRSYCTDRFLSSDDEVSVYHFIRTVTGEQDYTMENIIAAQNLNGRKR